VYFLKQAGANADLLEVATDGDGSPRRVMSGVQGGSSLSASAGGLLYTSETRSANLWKLSLPSQTHASAPGPAQAITQGTVTLADPAVSPDGTRIAYEAEETSSAEAGSRSSIHVLSLESGKTQQLTFLQGLARSPAWSPDGQSIAFGSTDGGTPHVWVTPASGGTPRSLRQTRPSTNLKVTWAPGRDILYQQADVTNYRLIELATETERPLIHGPTGYVLQARYSPDASQVAVLRNPGKPPLVLSLVSLTSGAERILTSTTVFPFGWSYDGRWIYAHDGRRALTRVSAADGSQQSLARVQGVPESCSVAPDGRFLVCAVVQSTSDLWHVVDLPR
jgi:dipeptidyl aminopeptidase/acylaminoacyl peptidase